MDASPIGSRTTRTRATPSSSPARAGTRPQAPRCGRGRRLSVGAPHRAGLERDRARARSGPGRAGARPVRGGGGRRPRGGGAALDGPFDAIVYGDVLEHLSDPLAALVALNRTLAAGGLVIVSVPNVAHLWVRLSAPRGALRLRDRGILDRTHLRFFTRRTFLALLERRSSRWRSWRSRRCRCRWWCPTRLHGAWLSGVHALSAAAARGWPSGLAYQFVAVCRPRAAGSPDAVASPSATRRAHDPPKVVVVMPAYNAGRTLRMTYEELPKDTVNLVILVDDGSTDATLEIARELGLEIFVHDRNYGYGANQKTCYTEALSAGRRRRRDGPSRLPVRPDAGAQDHRAHPARRGRPRARLAAQGRRLGDRSRACPGGSTSRTGS